MGWGCFAFPSLNNSRKHPFGRLNAMAFDKNCIQNSFFPSFCCVYSDNVAFTLRIDLKFKKKKISVRFVQVFQHQAAFIDEKLIVLIQGFVFQQDAIANRSSRFVIGTTR